MSRGVVLLALMVAAVSGARAERAPPVLDGAFVFTSTAMENGKPVCTERWLFADGVQTVESGREITRGPFHTEVDANGHYWLVRTMLETNGEPDCAGKRTATIPSPPRESRIYFLHRNNGSIVLCPPAQRMPDGVFFTGDCWGEATPEIARR